MVLVLFRRNPKEFLRRYITVNEMWMYCKCFSSGHIFGHFSEISRSIQSNFGVHSNMLKAIGESNHCIGKKLG